MEAILPTEGPPVDASTRIVTCLALLAGSRGHAQAPEPPEPSPPPVIRISTELIQLDALVVDRHGSAVTGLGVDDFEIFEAGERRTVTHVVWMGANAASQASGGTRGPDRAGTGGNTRSAVPGQQNPAPADGLRVVFFVDDLQLPFSAVHRAREALASLIETSLNAGDHVAMATSSGAPPMLGFTSDRDVLRQGAATPSYSVRSTKRLMPEPGVGGAFHLPFLLEPLSDPAREFEQNQNALLALRSLASVLQALRPYPGRKAVILLGEGWPWERMWASPALRGVTDQANRASVVISAIDPNGLEPHADIPGAGSRDTRSADREREVSRDRWSARLRRQASLEDLAGWTGAWRSRTTTRRPEGSSACSAPSAATT
jgi:VWFA-related protein